MVQNVKYNLEIILSNENYEVIWGQIANSIQNELIYSQMTLVTLAFQEKKSRGHQRSS